MDAICREKVRNAAQMKKDAYVCVRTLVHLDMLAVEVARRRPIEMTVRRNARMLSR
jgi:hypothetical protein